MQIGESKKLQIWITTVHKGRHDYYRDNGISPDAVSIDQGFYIELCAAAGMLIKSVDGMKVMVRWGDNCAR